MKYSQPPSFSNVCPCRTASCKYRSEMPLLSFLGNLKKATLGFFKKKLRMPTGYRFSSHFTLFKPICRQLFLSPIACLSLSLFSSKYLAHHSFEYLLTLTCITKLFFLLRAYCIILLSVCLLLLASTKVFTHACKCFIAIFFPNAYWSLLLNAY